MTEWPPPYLQPDHNKDCAYYAAAYLCRCLGFDTTAQDVMRYRAETRKCEDAYPQYALGLEAYTYRLPPGRLDQRFWLGPDARGWVQDCLAQGYIGLVFLHRIPTLGHSAVVLEAHEAGVLLMDPILGFVEEPWDWFLGIGPGNHGCHRIEAWYRGGRTDDDQEAI